MASENINILLADDDSDDCLLFKDMLDEMPLACSLTIVHEGRELMSHLTDTNNPVPHILFLDFNMPGKNGIVCLSEIKGNQRLMDMPVIIFSTSYDDLIASQLYEKGAHYYIRKLVDYNELKEVIYRAILLIQENKSKPSKEDFLLTKPTIVSK